MKKLFAILVLSILICPIAYSDVNIQSYIDNYDLIDDYIDMAKLYTSNAEYEKALEYINTVDKISPKNPKILYEKAIILKNYNQPILARNLMLEIVEIAPEYMDTYLYKEFFNNALSGFYASPQHYDADYYLKKGLEFYDECKYEKALDYFKKALEQRKDVQTVNYMGKTYIKLGDKAAAMRCFEDAINMDIKEPQTYINLAMYYCEAEKDSKKQIHYLKHAIKLDPKNPEAFYQLGNVYFEKGMYETAADYYRHALTKDDVYFDAYYALGSTLYKLQNYEESYHVFEKSLTVELDDVKVYEYLVKDAIRLRKFNEAKSYMQKAVSIKPTPENYITLAEVMYLLGEYDDAITLLNSKVADSKNAKMYNYLGLCYYQLNDYTAAVNNFKKAISIDPRPIYFYNLAVCYNTLGDKTSMQEYVNKAETARPKDIQDYLDIIKVYDDQNKASQVLSTLDKAILAYPNERQFYNLKLQILKQTGKNKEYNTLNVQMKSKFPKDAIYLGKDNARK